MANTPVESAQPRPIPAFIEADKPCNGADLRVLQLPAQDCMEAKLIGLAELMRPEKKDESSHKPHDLL